MTGQNFFGHLTVQLVFSGLPPKLNLCFNFLGLFAVIFARQISRVHTYRTIFKSSIFEYTILKLEFRLNVFARPRWIEGNKKNYKRFQEYPFTCGRGHKLKWENQEKIVFHAHHVSHLTLKLLGPLGVYWRFVLFHVLTDDYAIRSQRLKMLVFFLLQTNYY